MAKIIDSLYCYESKLVPYRQGVSISPVGIPSTGIFVNFQSFILPANRLNTSDTLIYEIRGQYADACTLQFLWNGTPVNWAVSHPLISIDAPTTPLQTYKATWIITKLNSAQANTYLEIVGGAGVNQFLINYSTVLSLIDWTVDIPFLAQGRCDNTTLSLDSIQATFEIK